MYQIDLRTNRLVTLTVSRLPDSKLCVHMYVWIYICIYICVSIYIYIKACIHSSSTSQHQHTTFCPLHSEVSLCQLFARLPCHGALQMIHWNSRGAFKQRWCRASSWEKNSHTIAENAYILTSFVQGTCANHSIIQYLYIHVTTETLRNGLWGTELKLTAWLAKKATSDRCG